MLFIKCKIGCREIGIGVMSEHVEKQVHFGASTYSTVLVKLRLCAVAFQNGLQVRVQHEPADDDLI